MSGIDGNGAAVDVHFQLMDGAMVLIERKHDNGICDGIAAQYACIVGKERMVSDVFLLQGLHEAVGEVGVVVVANFAQRYEVGLQSGQFLYDGFKTTLYHGAFLPYIPL